MLRIAVSEMRDEFRASFFGAMLFHSPNLMKLVRFYGLGFSTLGVKSCRTILGAQGFKQ